MRRQLVFAALSIAVALPGLARAQTVEASLLGSQIPPAYNRGRNTSVLERDRPGYEPAGLQVGGFTVFPTLELGSGYLSNVFATQTNEKSDGYAIIDPTITARSDWSRHSLTVSAGARLREFYSVSQENEEGAFLNVFSRIDIYDTNHAEIGGEVQKTYQERDTGDYPTGAAGPIPVVQGHVFGRFIHEGSRIRLVGAADYSHFSFDDVAAIGGGFIVEGDRDRSISRTSGRAEFALTPDTSIFGEAGYSRSNYDQRLFGGGANRDSQEYRTLGGVSLDLTALIRGAVALGYVDREYDSSFYRNISGFAADARLEYFPTELTTITLAAHRTIEDGIIDISGGFFNNYVSFRIDHELFRNLILSAGGSYENDDYQGADRQDEIAGASVSANYLLTRALALRGDFLYIDRTSSGSLRGPQFNEVRAALTVVLKR